MFVKKNQVKSTFGRKKRKSSKSALPAIGTLRNRADKICTPLIAKLHPRCLLCGQPTQVAHHFIHKSVSSRLRYDTDNLIPLCHKDHQALHHNESFYAARIIQIKGLEWSQSLLSRKVELVKTDRQFYLDAIKKLEDILYGQDN